MKEKINKFIHSKNFIIILILLLISLVGIVGTYAWFTWSSTENTSLTLTIGKLADVTFDNGNDINITNLAPVFNYTDGEKTTFSINNKDTTGATISYSVKLNITTIASELVSSSLKYKLMSNGAEMGSGDFSSASSGDTLTIRSGTLSSGITDFDFYIYIDGNIENDPNMMNKTLIGTITVDAYEGAPALITLANLGLSVETTHTPDFTTVSGNNGVKIDIDSGDTVATDLGDGTKGIYESEDDLGRSYYFRGAVENNYVSFAGMTWRIVRINGDGSIRIVLNEAIGGEVEETLYNNNFDDNAYVGYMYGTPGSSTYEATHANINNSAIKTYIDNWYQNNLSGYSQYIADAIYCNDRSITSVNDSENVFGITFDGTGIGTENTSYSGFKRMTIDYNPTLICQNNNDKFTVSNTIGNGALTYPIGLLTSDEVAMAGAINVYSSINFYIENNDYYLYNDSLNCAFMTMTPSLFIQGLSSNLGMLMDVYNFYIQPYEFSMCYPELSPVVSLKADAITSGSGIETDPFIVG